MTGSNFDLGSSEAPAEAVARRLDDIIGWFTTVRADGRPHAVPVWFLWWNDRALVMSEPDTVKVRNLRRAPHALLHLNADAAGDGIVVLEGKARISDRSSTDWLPDLRDPYTDKYAEAMVNFGMGIDDIAERFSTVIELTPTKLTAW
ncbi:hypothetical protein HJ590_09885 [Naumannella sp. ID2617S]|nr:hypothetical protein [Naumannella sp. ID2617S]